MQYILKEVQIHFVFHYLWSNVIMNSINEHLILCKHKPSSVYIYIFNGLQVCHSLNNTTVMLYIYIIDFLCKIL